MTRCLNVACHLTVTTAVLCCNCDLPAQEARQGSPFAAHPEKTWVKQSPLAATPPSPRLGYEGACVWDARHRIMIRYGGHNQGGGGEQGSEVWTFDPLTAAWTLKEPNTSPPGICCGQQNIFDPASGRYIRFPAFSASHGWQWHREVYLNDSSAWSYDLATNTWRNMRPLPAPHVAPLRCASWDSDRQVVVVFGGEGSQEGTLTYDPYRNQWKDMNPPRPGTRPSRLPGARPDFRSGGNMVYDAANKLHVLFGSQFSDDPHTWTYDLAKNEWRDMQPQTMPPTNQNDAVLTYDPIGRVVLALVKVSEGEEDDARHELATWAYDTAANTWTKLNPPTEPDASGNRARQLMFAPELNVAILENRTHKSQGAGTDEQQIWTFRYAEAAEEDSLPPQAILPRSDPPIVEDVVVSVVSPREVQVTWKPRTMLDDASAESATQIAGYYVERATVEVYSDAQLTRLNSRTPPLERPSVGAIRRIGQFQRLTEGLQPTTSFTDSAVDLTQPQPARGVLTYERNFEPEQFDEGGADYAFAVYAYRIRAVTAAGTESGASPPAFTIPSAPQWVFSQEDGFSCHLKWAANPEENIAGYRIYRMNGRWDSDPIARLTPEPLAATTYTDEEAGDATRRYYVIAVDTLGQEGFPSSPVWSNREWRPFYEPFVTGWHQ